MQVRLQRSRHSSPSLKKLLNRSLLRNSGIAGFKILYKVAKEKTKNRITRSHERPNQKNIRNHVNAPHRSRPSTAPQHRRPNQPWHPPRFQNPRNRHLPFASSPRRRQQRYCSVCLGSGEQAAWKGWTADPLLLSVVQLVRGGRGERTGREWPDAVPV